MKSVLVLFNLLYVVLLAPWLPVAVWSLVFLADPVDNSPIGLFLGRILPFSVLLYPVLLVISLISGWYLYRKGKAGAALLVGAGLPSLSVWPWFVALALMFGRVS